MDANIEINFQRITKLRVLVNRNRLYLNSFIEDRTDPVYQEPDTRQHIEAVIETRTRIDIRLRNYLAKCLRDIAGVIESFEIKTVA